MTTKRKGSRSKRGFELPKGRKTMIGKIPGPPEVVLDPDTEEAIGEFLPRLKGNRQTVEQKVALLALTTVVPGQKRMSLTDAYLSISKTPGMKRMSAASQASRLMREVYAEIGQEGVAALQGSHIRRIDRILADASGATMVRQFIDRSGNIVEAPPQIDYLVRLRSAELMMRRLGVGKENDTTAPVIVNVVSYLPGPVAEQRPWPGGGRACADGSFRPTVGPGSPAALALPPASGGGGDA